MLFTRLAGQLLCLFAGALGATTDPGVPTITGASASTRTGFYTGIDSCIDGAMCWDLDFSDDIGTCVAHCAGSFDDIMCEPGTTLYTIGFGAGCLCGLYPPCFRTAPTRSTSAIRGITAYAASPMTPAKKGRPMTPASSPFATRA